MYEMDPKALDRAQKLVKDARKKTWKYKTVGAMKRGWSSWREVNTKLGFGARALLTGGVSYGATIAGAAAAAAIGSATVLASIASFGIGPVIIGIAGFAIKTGISEFSYQRASRKVKAAVKKGNKPDIELIVPLTSKILKKLSRVTRRRNQLRKGFFGRGLAKLRHGRTAWRAWRKKKKGLHSGHTEFSGIEDPELYERLMELRYYGQISFNLVQHLMGSVITVRDQYAAVMNQVFIHTIRQVHVFGNHDTCGDTCYTISKKDWEKQLRKIANAPKTGVIPGHTQFSTGATQGSTARFEAMMKKKLHSRKSALDATSLLAKIEKASRDIDKVEKGESTGKKVQKGLATSQFKQRAIKKPLISALKLTDKSGKGQSGFSSALGGTYKAPNISNASELGKVSGKFAVVGAVDIVFDEVGKFVKNKWTRRKILKTRDAGLGLLEASDEDGNQAMTEVYNKIIKKASAQSQLQRLAEKVIHYFKKMNEMDEMFKDGVMVHLKDSGTPKFKDLTQDPPSAFGSCLETWGANSCGFHVFNNYNKYLVHLIYYEALMLNLDKQVSMLLPKVPAGSIIKAGQPDWPKPAHLVKRHGDLPLTSDSKELEEEDEEVPDIELEELEEEMEEEEEEVLDALAPMRRELLKRP